MAKRIRTESLTYTPSSNEGPLSPGASSSTQVLTPSTADDEHPAFKIQHVETPHSAVRSGVSIKCSLPPHPPQEFSSHSEHETHYRNFHTNRCHECQKNFPTDHYLDLHIAENHDPLNEAKRDRGEKTYACFVNGCDKVCLTPQRRRWHCLAKHEFPQNYDFFIVNDGIDKRKSMLRPSPRKNSTSKTASTKDIDSSAHSETSGAVAEAPNTPRPACPVQSTVAAAAEDKMSDADVEKVAESLSALRFVPQSVRFGRGRRGGLIRS